MDNSGRNDEIGEEEECWMGNEEEMGKISEDRKS